LNYINEIIGIMWEFHQPLNLFHNSIYLLKKIFFIIYLPISKLVTRITRVTPYNINKGKRTG
jgi:hypothetical protein